ncbi:hypothetical protein [Streptomyces radicis]|uniref:Uncharacterized protein n=1 Tax=Streptomyces radicis TaxID=1750517 RepID=A0A3A9W340_9ACTN|nr:hypothetical protein [Streptomyces radicis]RKN07260.1 hypothetical protein D7319_19500 [Streptomyces radicis]RKN26723.1 hypothetical protein D7318_05050 [Streptomyces radicis]
MVVDRPPLIAVKAAVLDLWGWGSSPLGVEETVPVESYAPMMMSAIVFGLSPQLRGGRATMAVSGARVGGMAAPERLVDRPWDRAPPARQSRHTIADPLAVWLVTWRAEQQKNP